MWELVGQPVALNKHQHIVIHGAQHNSNFSTPPTPFFQLMVGASYFVISHFPPEDIRVLNKQKKKEKFVQEL